MKYVDSTPHLHVMDSAFEDWFQAHPRACESGIKQMARDAYAAGMGDPLVMARESNTTFEDGVQAMFDALTCRAANHYHGNPAVQKQCAYDNKLIWDWSMEALSDIAPNVFDKMCEFYPSYK
jgi:hypothetical protein